MTLSEKIHKLRKDNHISQEELASQLGISRQAVSKWESGQSIPDTNNLLLLSKILSVSLDDLLQDNKVLNKKVSVAKPNRELLFLTGEIICSIGLVGSVIVSLMILSNSSVANQNEESITININGYFVAAFLSSMIFMVSMIFLFIRQYRK